MLASIGSLDAIQRCCGWCLCAQVGEEDYNQDGKPELIRFTATAQSRYPVTSFKLLLQFSYALQVGSMGQSAILLEESQQLTPGAVTRTSYCSSSTPGDSWCRTHSVFSAESATPQCRRHVQLMCSK